MNPSRNTSLQLGARYAGACLLLGLAGCAQVREPVALPTIQEELRKAAAQ